MSKGKFIIVEGGEGAGKDTHIERMRHEFGEEQFVYTREPGGTRLGKELRAMLLHESHGPVTLPAEIFLFLADRAQHVEELIIPSTNAGKHVISNRSWISFLAYQIYGRNMDEHWKTLAESAIKNIYARSPLDLAIILDVPYEVGKERMRLMGKELDVMERMPAEAHERIRQAFLTVARTLPQAVVIDASRPLDEVWKDVKEAVQSVI
jgi:dTMP kinase